MLLFRHTMSSWYKYTFLSLSFLVTWNVTLYLQRKPIDLLSYLPVYFLSLVSNRNVVTHLSTVFPSLAAIKAKLDCSLLGVQINSDIEFSNQHPLYQLDSNSASVMLSFSSLASTHLLPNHPSIPDISACNHLFWLTPMQDTAGYILTCTNPICTSFLCSFTFVSWPKGKSAHSLIFKFPSLSNFYNLFSVTDM